MIRNAVFQANYPEHIDFIKNRAIPVFEEWGYTVEILHATKDYLDCFHQIITKSKKSVKKWKKKRFSDRWNVYN